MKRTKRFLVGSLFLVVVVLTAVPTEAAIPTVYTNDNFFTSEHDAPVSFTQAADGSFSGVTVTGKTFYQRPVVGDVHVRLHRFSIDQAYFYISSYGLIMATSDTEALSIYLARAGYIEEVA